MQTQTNSLSGHVVQVTTTFGDSVVHSGHLWPAQKNTRWRWMAGAAAAGAIAIGAFIRGLASVAADAAARTAWLAQGHAAADFRPGHLSIAYDIVAASAAILAVFCAVRALSRWRPRDSTYDFGSGNGDAIRATGTGAHLSASILKNTTFYRDGLEIAGRESIVRGAAVHGDDGGVIVARDAMAVIDHGISRTIVRSVPAPRTGIATAAWFQIEGRAAQIFAASAIGHAVLLLVLSTIAPEAQTLSLDSDLALARISSIRDAAYADPYKERNLGTESGGEQEATEQAQMAPPPGVTGDPQNSATSGRYEIKQRADSPQLARGEVLSRARQGGILGVLSASDPFANMVGTADFSSQFAASDYRGGIDGFAGELGGSWGQWGIDGGVGNGPGYGTVASGPYATRGSCVLEDCSHLHGGTYSAHALGGFTGISHKKPDSIATIGEAKVDGGLDKSIIRRYVRRKLPRIQHCYEARLIEAQDVSGTVVVQWMINTEGAVLGARASGSGDRPLDDCVRSAVESIRFPRTKQLVNVTYPFTFHRAG